jgi:hypothetical protein
LQLIEEIGQGFLCRGALRGRLNVGVDPLTANIPFADFMRSDWHPGPRVDTDASEKKADQPD